MGSDDELARLKNERTWKYARMHDSQEHSQIVRLQKQIDEIDDRIKAVSSSKNPRKPRGAG